MYLRHNFTLFPWIERRICLSIPSIIFGNTGIVILEISPSFPSMKTKPREEKEKEGSRADMKKRFVPVLVAVLWILVMVAVYYWGHKPIESTSMLAVLSVVFDLVILLAVILTSGGLGRRVLPATSLGHLERSALQFSAGMGMFSLLCFLLGIFGLFHWFAAWLMPGVVGALFFRQCNHWRLDFFEGAKELISGNRLGRFLFFILALIICLQFLVALAPPLKYDALTYHLQIPREYIHAGKMIFLADNPYWGHPQMGEMLFTWMLLLHRPQTGALLSAAWGVFALLGIASSTRRMLSNCAKTASTGGETQQGFLGAGLVAVLALLAGSTFRWMFGWAYTDLLSVLMGWASLSAALALLKSKEARWLYWAALFAGAAIAVKWTGALLPAGVFTGLLFLRGSIRLPLKHLLTSAGLVVLVAAPWLVRNLVATSNPLYPYFFPTEWISPLRLEAASAGDSALPFWQVFLFPLTSTILGWDSAPGYGADLGPLLALFVLPGLWFARRERFGKILLVCLGLVWLSVALGGRGFNHLQQPRLYFALLPVAGLAAGWGYAGLSRLRIPALRVERLLAALLVLVLILTLLQDLIRSLEIAPGRVLAGLETEQTYLERNLGMYALAMQALHELPEGSQTLMLWEGRGLYAPINASADPWIDRWRADYWRYGSADAVLEAWRTQGFTHLLLYGTGMEMVRAGGSPLESEGWQALDAMLARLPEPVHFGDVYVLYPLSR